jgi:hypothetical protein
MPTVIGWLDEVLARDQAARFSAMRSNSPKSKRPRVEANGLHPDG